MCGCFRAPPRSGSRAHEYLSKPALANDAQTRNPIMHAHSTNEAYHVLRTAVIQAINDSHNEITEAIGSAPLCFPSNAAAGGGEYEMLTSPLALLREWLAFLNKLDKARGCEKTGRSLVFEGDPKGIRVNVVGRIVNPTLSEGGNQRKNGITSDHKAMRQCPNGGGQVLANYGRYANESQTHRQTTIVPLAESCKSLRYLPEGATGVMGILRDLSLISMKVQELISFVHNWYAVQWKDNVASVSAWKKTNWATLALTNNTLGVKSAEDVDQHVLAQLGPIVKCILDAPNIKAMPCGGYYARNEGAPEGRVTAKTFPLQDSKRTAEEIRTSWDLLAVAYAEAWCAACEAKQIEVHSFKTRKETEITPEGLPRDRDAFYEFMTEHIDMRYGARILSNIAEHKELPVPMGKIGTQCFDLLDSEMRSVRVEEHPPVCRPPVAQEYYRFLTKDHAFGGGIVVAVVELRPNDKGRDIYMNLAGLRTLLPARFMCQLEASWETRENREIDPTKPIACWVATDGIENQRKAMSLGGNPSGKANDEQLALLTLKRSSLGDAPPDAPTPKRLCAPASPTQEPATVSPQNEDEF